MDETEVQVKDDRKSGPDYSVMAYHLTKPHSRSIIVSYRVANRSELTALIKYAVSKQLYVYYSRADNPAGMMIDFDSVPEFPYATKPETPEAKVESDALSIDHLKCPICEKQMKSKSGYTLHMKQVHDGR